MDILLVSIISLIFKHIESIFIDVIKIGLIFHKQYEGDWFISILMYGNLNIYFRKCVGKIEKEMSGSTISLYILMAY